MPTFFQDEINVDIIQHTPRIAPVLGRANSPTNGAIWYDSASNTFQGVVNGVVAAIGGAGAPAFSAITPGTNTGALVIGTGGSLTTSGTGTITATPGGSNTQIQYNNSGVLGGSSQFTLAVGSSVNINNIPLFMAANTSIAMQAGATPTFFSGYGVLWQDSVTHTFSQNPDNNGVMSFTGAWVNTNVTPVTVNANVATDQNLMSVSIPAGTLNRVGRSLRLWLAGMYSTPAASTTAIVVKAKLGALTLATWTSTALAGIQATNDQFNVSANFTTQTGGATAAFEGHGNLIIDLGVGNTVADTIFADVNTTTISSVDLTAAQTLQITIAFTVASASNSATQRQMVLETIG